jgi:hypothetical protein
LLISIYSHLLTFCSVTKPISLDGDNGSSTTQSMTQKWNGLPSTTKYIIAGVVGGVLLLAIIIFAFCCIRQRRAGKHERLVEDAKYEKMQGEVLAYRADMNRARAQGFATEKTIYGVNGSVQHFSPVSPHVGMGGAGGYFPQSQPMYSQNQPMLSSPNPGYGYGPGRGYQKY